jgi:hypothetical protein
VSWPSAKNTVDEANSKLRVLLEGSRPEVIESVEAEVERLQVRRRQLANELRLGPRQQEWDVRRRQARGGIQGTE